MTAEERYEAMVRDNMTVFARYRDGSYQVYWSPRAKGVSLARCQEIVEKLGGRSAVVGLKIDIEWSQRMVKTAVYNAAENNLKIYHDGECVYENANGKICNDYVALADCGN